MICYSKADDGYELENLLVHIQQEEDAVIPMCVLSVWCGSDCSGIIFVVFSFFACSYMYPVL